MVSGEDEKEGWWSWPGPAQWTMARWVFVRGLGLVYLAAILSWWVQVDGLVGDEGIQPAGRYMEAVEAHCEGRVWGSAFWKAPTLVWLSPGNAQTMLHWLCGIGVVCAVAVTAGFLTGPLLLLLWLIYLSLATTGSVFMGYQWDNLLLEVGLLAPLLAPWRLYLRRRDADGSRWVVFLYHWLLFRLMFMAGYVKLSSGDEVWWNLTALNFHYETQPIPGPLAWYAHQLPGWMQWVGCLTMFVIELGLPFFIFLGRWPRMIAAGGIAALMGLIILTGNYNFFNWLAILLCVLLLDDSWWPRKWRGLSGVVGPVTSPGGIGRGWRRVRVPGLQELQSRDNTQGTVTPPGAGWTMRRVRVPGLQWMATKIRGPVSPPGDEQHRSASQWGAQSMRIVVGTAVVLLSLPTFVNQLNQWERAQIAKFEWPKWVGKVTGAAAPFRSVNGYGLFAVMTTTRPEIEIEGSRDGIEWETYGFKWKTGEPGRRPRMVAPHQPRLDWQMWFEALGAERQREMLGRGQISGMRVNPWFGNFLVRLFENSEPVVGLMRENPFPDEPPRYLRARMYQYRFSDGKVRRETGDWWVRTGAGELVS